MLMAQQVGAAITEAESFYGHVLSRDAMHSDKLWPYPLVDQIAISGIVVDEAGKRFVDEGMGGVFIANAIARLADPLAAVAILDQAIWEGPARERLVPPNPNLIEGGATIFRAATIGELQRQAGLGFSLASTIEAYNGALYREHRRKFARRAAAAHISLTRLPMRRSTPFPYALASPTRWEESPSTGKAR